MVGPPQSHGEEGTHASDNARLLGTAVPALGRVPVPRPLSQVPSASLSFPCWPAGRPGNH